MNDCESDNVLECVRRIELFSSLTEAELRQIVAKMTVKRYRKNEIVFYEEDSNRYMYMILRGKVKVMQTTEEGKEVILAFHRSGEFFGEISLIDSRTSPAIVVATEESVIAVISRGVFLSILHTQGKVLDVMLQILCGRLRDSWERIQILSFSNASQRIRMLLHMLSDEHGRKVKNGTVLNMRLTHQDIANMTGIARETVSRILFKWSKDGYVEVLKNRALLLSDRFVRSSLEGDFENEGCGRS